MTGFTSLSSRTMENHHSSVRIQHDYILISAPIARSQIIFLSLTLSVRLSVTNIASSFLFLDGIEPFMGRQFIMTPSTKRCS